MTISWLDVSDTTPRISYVATSGQTTFAVPFAFHSATHLAVYKNSVLLTYPTHYTVTGVDEEAGGSIILVTGATVSDSIVIARVVPFELVTHIPPSGPLDVPAINIQFALFVMMLQQLIADGFESTIPSNGVTNTKLADMAQSTIKGRAAAAGTGDPQDLTPAQARTVIGAPTSIVEFGAVGDGSNDTVAVTAANAAARAKFVPDGTYATTLAASALDGPFWGRGQVQSVDTNKRGPWFSAIKAVPTSFGDYSSVSTAFNGDISKVQIAMEHRIIGVATATQPASGYAVTEEISAISIFAFNQSGHNQSTSIPDGRTGNSILNLNYNHSGQGDYGAIWINGIISTSRAGATHFLANPAGIGIFGQIYAGATGVYLNVSEVTLNDNGFQAAAVGAVYNFNRTVATSTLGEVWFGIRPQSSGSAAADVAYSATGPWKRCLDTTAITFDSDKAAITLNGGDRIYWNSTTVGTVAWSQTVGAVYTAYNGTTGALEVAGAKFGYAAGSGGAITQGTSRTTGVTLDKVSGAITLFTAAGSATAASFTVTNSTVAATDTISLSVKSGTNKYLVFVTTVAAGSFEITFNTTGGTSSDAPVINFNVIRGVAA